MRRWSRVLLSLLALSLVAAACGDDDDDGAAAPTEEETPSASQAPDCTLPGPVRVYFGVGKGRESTDPNAIADFQDGWEMAVEEINDAGGICGQDLVWDGPIDTAPAGEAAITDFQRAIDYDPAIAIAFASSSALDAAAEIVRSSGLPTLHMTTNFKAREGGSAAAPNLFGMRVPNDEAAAAAATYALEELDACNIGLVHFNLAFGQEGADVQKKVIADAGCTIHSEQSHAFNAEDLTNEIAAMDGADAVINWGTPNTVTLSVNTTQQQGLLDIPVVLPGSAGFSSFYTNVDPEALENAVADVDCNAVGTEWGDAFEERYDYPPSYSAVESYDAAFLIKAVLEAAESFEPADVIAQLEQVSYEGECQTYTNDRGFLTSESTIISFDEDGRPVTDETVPFSYAE